MTDTVSSNEHPGLDALRAVLRRLRWDNQGGYPGYEGDGKWSFVTTGLPQTTPDELNQLFALAGIEPDVIMSLGHCEDCAHSVDGQERGYKQPCSGCLRPLMSNFVQLRTGR